MSNTIKSINAREILDSRGRAFGFVGVGETVAACKQVKMIECVDRVSTSGGDAGLSVRQQNARTEKDCNIRWW